MASGCSYFESARCLSCDLLDLPYDEQLQRKQRILEEVLAATIQRDGPDVLGIVPSDAVFGSRSKAKMAVGGTSRSPAFGFPTKGSDVVDIAQCPLHQHPIPAVLEAARSLVQAHQLEPYDISQRRGELKYLIVKLAQGTGEMLVRLVLRSRDRLAHARAFFEALRERFPCIQVASVNIQPAPMAIIEGKEEIILSERETILEELAGVKFVYSPQSFTQVTPGVAANLYAAAAGEIAQRAPRMLLDLYCGVGAFSLFSAQAAKRIVGVEIVPRAIENARQAASLNGFHHVEFLAADAEKFLEEHRLDCDAAIVNPPRRGLSEKSIECLKRAPLEVLVYSSCSLPSLARDLELLRPSFRVVRVRGFDMFPGTSHLETLVALVRA